MNGTIIDIPGISVSVNPIALQDSTDKAHTVTIKDQQGNSITIDIAFGKIIQTQWKK